MAKKTNTKKTDTTKKESGNKEEELKEGQIKEENRKEVKEFKSIYKLVNEDTTKEICNENNSGFYYDSQLNDPFLSITLHANTIKDKNSKEWKLYEGDTLDPISDSTYSKNYMAEPLARCILTEDLAYSIQNNFTDNNMGNPIESMFETFKPYAPILGNMADGLTKGAGEVAKANNFGSALASAAGNIGKAVAPWMKSASNFLNKALMVQGTRFTYYNGTSFNFNNLEMKFTVFSDYDKNGKFYSVEDYIQNLAPYVMGEYHPATNYKELKTGNDTADKFIHDYVGFQEPPGGFTMDTKNLNNVLKGTLRLNIGGMWAIENLVLKNMNVVLSKVQAKNPDEPGGLVPLYADITLQLAPACTIVDTVYDKITQHSGLTKIRSAATNTYSSRLETLVNKISGELNS